MLFDNDLVEKLNTFQIKLKIPCMGNSYFNKNLNSNFKNIYIYMYVDF